jgi:hypothetical protein
MSRSLVLERLLEPLTMYDHASQRMQAQQRYENPALEMMAHCLRARCLTSEQAAELKEDGIFSACRLPQESTRWPHDLAPICAGLRLTSHGDREHIGAECVHRGLMPQYLLQYCGRNEHGQPMPVPVWTSSGALPQAGKLAAGFCNRNWPFRIASCVVVLWLDERDLGVEEKESQRLIQTIQQLCDEHYFDPLLRDKWVNEMKFWRSHLSEWHHKDFVDVKYYLARNEAVVVSLDLDNGKNNTGVNALSYADLARCAFAQDDSVEFYAAFWSAVVHQIHNQLPDGNHVKKAMLDIAHVSCKNDIECWLFENAGRSIQGPESRRPELSKPAKNVVRLELSKPAKIVVHTKILSVGRMLLRRCAAKAKAAKAKQAALAKFLHKRRRVQQRRRGQAA